MIRMRYLMFVLVSMILMSGNRLNAQNPANLNLGNDPSKYVGFAQSIYWSALSMEEKQTFIFAYISSAYETRSLANQIFKSSSREKKKFNDKIDWYFRIWGDLLDMKQAGDISIDEFIGWIDLFYSIDFNQDKLFSEALAYAYRKVKGEDKALLELFLGRSLESRAKLSVNEVLQQQTIKKQVAKSAARDVIMEFNHVMPETQTAETPTPIDDSPTPLSDMDTRIVNMAVEVECVNHSAPEKLMDPVFLQNLAEKFGFKTVDEFNRVFEGVQRTDRWEKLHRLIVEHSFDQGCM